MNVYHFKRPKMIDEIFIPLNAQKELYREAYEEHKKSMWRERVFKKIIPILNYLWNDVLHFSPINPPEKNTGSFQPFNYDFNNFYDEKVNYCEFSQSEYRELSEVLEKHIEIWQEDHKAGRNLFWFSYTMHALSKTTVDISKCETIVCRYKKDFRQKKSPATAGLF